MDDHIFKACADMSFRASRLLAGDQDRLRRSSEQVALSRELLALPVYPDSHVPPHDPFDFSGLKAVEPGE